MLGEWATHGQPTARLGTVKNSPGMLSWTKIVRPEKIPIFGKRQNGNFGQNPNFFKISDDETNFIVGIVSQNLATKLNFVEF